jgi:hypothetical protein
MMPTKKESAFTTEGKHPFHGEHDATPIIFEVFAHFAMNVFELLCVEKSKRLVGHATPKSGNTVPASASVKLNLDSANIILANTVT